jgi:ABC-2 type transport system ATP-binding protein
MVSSHILSEIESMADNISVIHHGRMKKEITMNEISSNNLEYIELEVSNAKQAAYILSDKLNLSNFKIVEENKIRIYDLHLHIPELSKTLALHDVDILALGKKVETLEDYFLKMTAEVEQG